MSPAPYSTEFDYCGSYPYYYHRGDSSAAFSDAHVSLIPGLSAIKAVLREAIENAKAEEERLEKVRLENAAKKLVYQRNRKRLKNQRQRKVKYAKNDLLQPAEAEKGQACNKENENEEVVEWKEEAGEVGDDVEDVKGDNGSDDFDVDVFGDEETKLIYESTLKD